MHWIRIFVPLTLLAFSPLAAVTAQGVHDVREHGAAGDGKRDDTAAIQAAVDAAAETGGTVIFPPGTYMVTSIGLRPGVRYSGYGATIRRPANQGKWVRTFDAGKSGYLYSSDEDSQPLTIEGFIFDGNRLEQAAYAQYQLEQAHLINLVADSNRSGRLQVRIRDCYFKDCVADAISVYTNVRLAVSDCTARDCFRGGLTVTGGYTQVQANNLTTLGQTHATGIDVEVDGGGFRGSHRVDIKLDGLMLHDGDLDIGVSGESLVVGTNIIAPRAPFNLYAGGTATLLLSNCVFGVGEFSSTGNRITLPGKTSFSNCTFRIEGTSDEAERKWAAAHVYWSIGDTPTSDQSVSFSDCKFEVCKTIAERDVTYALYLEADRPENNNRLTLHNSQISRGYDYGVFLAQGGRAILKDLQTEASTALWLGASEHYPLDVVVDGVELIDCQTYLHMVTHVEKSRLTHKNSYIDAALNAISTSYGLAGNQYLGSRTILGTSPPTGTTPGLLHDIYQVPAAQAGLPRQWICTASGAGNGAAWEPVAQTK